MMNVMHNALMTKKYKLFSSSMSLTIEFVHPFLTFFGIHED